MPFVPGFLPSQNAPLFPNDGIVNQQPMPWPPGTVLTVSIPGLPTVSIDATHFGLCGGMAFLTRDIFQAGTPQLRGTVCTQIPVALANYLVTRLEQSFDGPATVLRWLAMTALPDHDTAFWGPGDFHQTVNGCPAIMNDIDHGILSPVGLILTGPSWWPGDVFSNHVELVFGYEHAESGELTLHVYDCDNPGRDDITISLDISSPTPAKVISTNGTSDPDRPGQMRGFFRLPYTFASPAPAYIDDATVLSNWFDAVMTPGENDTATVVAVNTGSTSWTPALDYRLGSQSPEDNTTWGTARVELPVAQVDPQGQAVFTFPVTAPAAPGRYTFCWQMVRDPDHFFGTSSAPETVLVADAGDATVVPDVIGTDEATAKQAITAAGLQCGAFLLHVPDHGTVVRQSPPGGTAVVRHSGVSIWVATGPNV
jgi:hypothetical protein